jgi:AraC-like DNA-binding protein
MSVLMRGYFVHRPAPPLAGVVDYFWSLSDVPSHSRELVIPSGTIEIVFPLHDVEIPIDKLVTTGEQSRRLRGGVVSGAYSRAFAVETRVHASIVGVHLKPGGAASLLGISAGELANTHVELEALWGRRSVELRDRLCEAANSSQRFRILEQALIGSLSRSPGVRREVAFALDKLCAPGVEVGDVARHVQLSHRRFIELFTEQVGMTPKRYARVQRLQRALRLVTAQGAPAWAHVALDCGYFDQAHLCRDWVELTGSSPTEFLLRLRNVPVKDNHVALPEPPRSILSNTPPPAVPTLSANGGRNASRQI